MKYKIIDMTSGESTTIEAESPKEARRLTREWVRECEDSYDTSDGSVYVDVRIEDEAGDPVDFLTVVFRQPEPKCSDERGHDWRSPVVRGHGGGVITTERCTRCECKRITDTWAQRRDTGEQGLTEVTYEADERSGR